MVIDLNSTSPITFQSKYAEEEFQFYFRQHWIRLALPFIRLLAVSIVIIGGGLLIFLTPVILEPMARHTVLVLLCVFFLLTQFEFLEKYYNHFLYQVIVTDRRVHRMKKTLFVTDDQQSIDLWVLQDIHKIQHGFIQCGLRFGTLALEAQETIMKIHFVPDVSHKYEQLMHLREKARKQARMMGMAPQE